MAIKQLGTNGGGFFGPNSTQPFENPNFWTNALSMIAIILIPMACVWMFGRIIGRMRHAAVVFGVMLALVLVRIAVAVSFETAPTEAFAGLPIEQTVGNLEGKELRFGAASGPTLGGAHHLDQQRLGRRHARQPQSADRPDADDRHVAQRGLSAASASA